MRSGDLETDSAFSLGRGTRVTRYGSSVKKASRYRRKDYIHGVPLVT